MKDTLRIVRVFLASPGDLVNERRLANAAIDEINTTIADFLGFRVELKGWEDTLSGSGRPQALINQELDLCELFIGMMWRRWGTPPSTDGPYSSGFQEEFERSSLRRKKTGKPEMAMYFKKVGEDLLADPGADLKKCLDFKTRLISEKQILFEEFADSHDVQSRIRQKVQKYLIRLRDEEDSGYETEQSKTKQPDPTTKITRDKDSKSPFSSYGHAFLLEFLNKTMAMKDTEEIMSFEVARLRLLCSAVSTDSNDQPYLGPHDANIIFQNRADIKFGIREIVRLQECGLKNISGENVPLWYWYAALKKHNGCDILPYKSLYFEDEGICVGALEAMRLVGSPLPIVDEQINRGFFIRQWFSESCPERVKLAALSYLKYHGKDEDIPAIRDELGREDVDTSRSALEALLGIQLRYNKSEAFKTALTNQFDTLDDALLEDLLSPFLRFQDDILQVGFHHRNKKIRLYCFDRLKKAKTISHDVLTELKNDPDVLMRKAIVEYLLSLDESLSDNEIKDILVKPQSRGGLGSSLVSALVGADTVGQVCYEEYLFSKYCSMAEKELLELLENHASIYDTSLYFALCYQYFANYADSLRKGIDDTFKERFEKHIEKLKSIGTPANDLITRAREMEDFTRQKLTRLALDILCRRAKPEDLHRVRATMRSGYVKSSFGVLDYLAANGEWEDIPFLANAEKDYFGQSIMGGLSKERDWSCHIAKALYRIGGDRLEELLTFEMPAGVLVDLIKLAASSRFSELSDRTLVGFFDNPNDKIRKAASVKSIHCLKKTRIKDLLSSYGGREFNRYYNVIFWLDFGVVMPRKTIIRTVPRVFSGG